ncbi:hypothetical protein [Sporisorium scitamineum]|nr:hypothetical protein [Sporisorium scitamineum]
MVSRLTGSDDATNKERVESLTSNTSAKIDSRAKLNRNFHMQSERPGMLALDPHNENLLQGYPEPDTNDHPLTPLSLKNSMQICFSGVNRLFKATLTREQRRQDFDEIAPYSRLEREQYNSFVDVLENKGYVFAAKRRKHILTEEELQQVAAALWNISIKPIDRIAMGLSIAIEVAAGLRPGEMMRYNGYENKSVEADKRLAPFLWKDVELYFLQVGTNVDPLEPSFFLCVEWKYGKSRQLGEIIPTQTSNAQPADAPLSA